MQIALIIAAVLALISAVALIGFIAMAGLWLIAIPVMLGVGAVGALIVWSALRVSYA